MFEHHVVLRAAIQLLVEFTIVVVVSGNHAAFLHHLSEMVHLLAAFLDLIGGLGHESAGTDHVLQPQLAGELDTLGEAVVIHDLLPGEVAAVGFQA
jgi:hypothetical protein